MKITYTVWLSDKDTHSEEHVIDSWDKWGVVNDFNASIELRRLRFENSQLRKEAADAIASLRMKHDNDKWVPGEQQE